MEIGAFGFLFLVGIVTLWAEKTKSGEKFFNWFGKKFFDIDLEQMDKRAQVSTEEIKQYDDVTTLEYLTMYEKRMEFVEEMKENGFEISIEKNPIFYDEPDKEDIDNGTFDEAEEPEEPEQTE